MKRALPIIIFFGVTFAVLIFLTYYEPPKRDVLDEGIWKVANLIDTPLVEGTTLTIRFHDGNVKGSSGCNTFSGRYEVQNEHITITALELTTDNCMKPGIMEQERAFTKFLAEVDTFAVSKDELVLTAKDGGLVKFESMLTE